ncbi:hypothetical protein [Pseudomonas sp. B329]|uniref:hypothetical protein n=1 Tax=Pseudomonas sp. B329 TaxID=1553459 RepID=UPI00200365F6|nr:hypothetical protein [Pseudomonas sp. B329]MCK3866140.1 hypothetical protein [Pseudomonas sp. B329]
MKTVLSVYTMNTLNMGRGGPGSAEEQIKILGDILLAQNADVSVLPEVSQGLFGSGRVDELPSLANAEAATQVSNVADLLNQVPLKVANVAADILDGVPYVGNVFGNWVKGIVGVATSAVSVVVATIVAPAVGKAVEVKVSAAGTVLKAVVEVTGAIVGKDMAEGALEAVIKAPIHLVGIQTGNLISGDDSRLKELVAYMNKHSSDGLYQYAMNGTTATISKYSLLETKANAAGGTSTILDLDNSGDVSNGDIHLDSVHLPAEKYTAWLPRGLEQKGYEGTAGTPVTDLETLREHNKSSSRQEEISKVIAHHDKNYAHLAHVITGDFNEPSHQDWTEATSGLYGHNGVIYQWDTTKKLTDSAYLDTFRAVYPDPVKNPGFTWASEAAGGSFKGSPVDDRDRIDFTFIKSGQGTEIRPVGANLVGNEGFYVSGELIEKGGSPNDVILSKGMSKWPSDHKGIFIKLEVSSAPHNGEVPEVQLVGSHANFDIT